jgi:hypothetical protein
MTLSNSLGHVLATVEVDVVLFKRAAHDDLVLAIRLFLGLLVSPLHRCLMRFLLDHVFKVAASNVLLSISASHVVWS